MVGQTLISDANDHIDVDDPNLFLVSKLKVKVGLAIARCPAMNSLFCHVLIGIYYKHV